MFRTKKIKNLIISLNTLKKKTLKKIFQTKNCPKIKKYGNNIFNNVIFVSFNIIFFLDAFKNKITTKKRN